MATSTRASSRAPEDMRAPEPAPEESRPKRDWPAPVVYTDEALADARRRYEQTEESLDSIAAGLGTSARSLQRIARPEGWVRYERPPRDATPAARLLMETRALEECAAPPEQESPPADTGAILDRLLRAG